MIGFAAEIFFVPVLIAASIGLAITIIGIPFVAVLMPIAIVLAVFAFVLGFTALACRVGEWVEDRLGWQPGNAFIATAIGFILLLAPTLIARFVERRVRPHGAAHVHAGRDRPDGGIYRVDDGTGRGDHHRPGPLVYGAAADHRDAGAAERRGLPSRRSTQAGLLT